MSVKMMCDKCGMLAYWGYLRPQKDLDMLAETHVDKWGKRHEKHVVTFTFDMGDIK